MKIQKSTIEAQALCLKKVNAILPKYEEMLEMAETP